MVMIKVVAEAEYTKKMIEELLSLANELRERVQDTERIFYMCIEIKKYNWSGLLRVKIRQELSS